MWTSSTLAIFKCFLAFTVATTTLSNAQLVAPKVFIVGYFSDEQTVWHNIPEFDLLAQNFTLAGLSVQYPDVHCTKDGSICQLTTAEGEINAANSAMALILSPLFDLIKTYFFLGGISGISPKVGTLGAVAFASWAVQVGMQYEIDAREKPNNFSTGYIPLGSTDPSEYPQYIYGTEAHVINDELRQLVILFAQNATLNDTTSAQAYRQLYANQSDFTPALSKPSVIACDTATSDVWWSGSLIGSAFENTTKLFTNGSATMCTSAQEDNAVLGALMRGAVAHLVDFSRVIVMRTASDFDRPPANMTVVDNLTNGQGAGYDAAVLNIYLAGIKVVQGIVEGWNTTFEAGIQPKNYIGDIFGSLGGTPNFGPGSLFNGKAAPVPPPAPRMTPSSSALRSLSLQGWYPGAANFGCVLTIWSVAGVILHAV